MNDPLGRLFDQFVKERVYLKAVTPKTRAWYGTAWKAYRASQPCSGESSLSKSRLQAFVVDLRDRGVKPRSVNTYLQALNAFGRWLQEEGHDAQRVRLAPLRTETRVLATLTPPQIRSLLSFKPKGFAQRRVHVAACLILDTGLRIDELLRLKPSDVDFDNTLVTVFGKGQKERRVPFSLEMRRALYRWSQACAADVPRREFMFPARDGGSWQQRNSLRSLYLLQERLGLPKFGWHRLRHTFATEYLRAGGQLVRLSRILGHSQVTTTMKYEHLLTEDLQEPHSRLSPVARHR